MSLPKLICIVGPTASGKTELAIKLAKKLGGEIVSADSRQIYRGMDIGTAKAPISPASRLRWRVVAKSNVPSHDGTEAPVISGGIPHHLIDIRNPNQAYTLAQYQIDAVKAIKSIVKRGKLPFLVGGTGLYMSAVVENWLIPKSKPNKRLRAKLMKDMQKHGLHYLFGKLTALDPEAAYVVDSKNPRRVIRALEVVFATGKPFTKQRQKGRPLFNILLLGLKRSSRELKSRIRRRTRQMFQAGLVDEVKGLMKKYGKRRVPFDAIGYREIIQALDGKISLPKAQADIITHTWQFARRQLTWFKKMPVVWVKNQKETEKEIKNFLARN